MSVVVTVVQEGGNQAKHRRAPDEAITRAHRVATDRPVGLIGVRESIIFEITQISRNVLHIEQNFAVIAKAIEKFDLLEVLRDADAHPLKFFPQWNSCREVMFHSFFLCSARLKSNLTSANSRTGLFFAVPVQPPAS